MPRPADGAGGSGRPVGNACAWVRERIDPLLDGELAAADAAALQEHLAGCPACRAEVALARSLQGALRDGLPPLACPPEVSRRVMETARREARAGRGKRRAGAGGLGSRIRDWLGGRRRLRPALAAAALVLLLAAPFLYRRLVAPSRPATPAVATLPAGPATGETAAAGTEGAGAAVGAQSGGATRGARYSPAEVAAARAQARLVFAYVAAVGRDAGRAVEDDVFARGIVRPARHAVENLGAAPIAEPRRKP